MTQKGVIEGLLSRLHAYVEALGGKLEIRARCADREIDIKQFRDVEKLQADLSAARSG